MTAQGRGGRGRGNGYQNRRFQPGNCQNNSGDNTKSTGVQKTMEFYPHSARSQQSVTYEVVKDFILDKIQREYQNPLDVIKSLRELQKVDLDKEKPERQQSKKKKDEEKAFEQQTFDMEYDALIQEYIERKKDFKANLNNAFALIKSFCNQTMVNKLEALPDYEAQILDDPIKLLENIKILMHDPECARYEFGSLTEAMQRVVNIKQLEDENLIDYVKRFKQA